ncbi:MAG TPA: hypothetical protein VJJ77_03975 [Dongiaceae bacterium]|nr:hypothetical protein [Dongiaceae bacterium]
MTAITLVTYPTRRQRIRRRWRARLALALAAAGPALAWLVAAS